MSLSVPSMSSASWVPSIPSCGAPLPCAPPLGVSLLGVSLLGIPRFGVPLSVVPLVVGPSLLGASFAAAECPASEILGPEVALLSAHAESHGLVDDFEQLHNNCALGGQGGAYRRC